MDNNSESFSFRGRMKSIKHAVDGIFELFKSQHNAWIHCFATLCVFSCGVFFQVTVTEWCFLVFAIVAVLVAEGFNTAFEALCDAASPEFHPLVKQSKDVAAGAVLLCALGSAIVGCIIFIPYGLEFIQGF